ncbi:hypothetical protein N8K70_02835 [Microbacterium betulae]|uniref:Uncharacterized protein n=1 Tax=Microbacterium betulae TaxID=2981139 RepID=A0AA97FI37_9MICO|nr:hypothetical protein [Microbacterium sp. AB]WOF23633.1 hypothetical protein N8K70_02835 [Microbacterium sp. AB]
MSRNSIAKTVGLYGAVVTKIAKQLGLSFDRSATAAAVEAHRVDLAESRQLLAEKMMAAAHGLLDSLDSPYEVFNFGGKDNTFNSHTLQTSPVEVKRSIMTTAETRPAAAVTRNSPCAHMPRSRGTRPSTRALAS